MCPHESFYFCFYCTPQMHYLDCVGKLSKVATLIPNCPVESFPVINMHTIYVYKEWLDEGRFQDCKRLNHERRTSHEHWATFKYVAHLTQ